MGKYDVEGTTKDGDSGCRCSTSVGFLLILLAAAVAVGVGIIVHFAGNKNNETICNFNVTGLVPSSMVKDSCQALAAKGDRDLCSACPETPTTTMSITNMTSTTPEPTRPPATLRLPVVLKPVSYQINIRPDFYSNNISQFMFNGSSSVIVKCEEDTSQIVMHLKDLQLEENSIIVQEDNTVENLYVSHHLEDGPQFIVIKTKTPLVKGRNYVIKFLKFSAPIRDDFTGLYRGMFTENGVDSHYVMTQMEVLDARKVFPCFDEPAMKATFQMTIARKDGYVTITNSPLKESLPNSSTGWIEETFEMTPIMPTYLLAIIVGKFVYSEKMTDNNIKARVFSKPSAENQTAYALDIGARILTSFENYFGIPFPIPKQDMIAINAFQFTAMENWGAIVFFENAILYEETLTSFRDKYMISHVISHEVAHNWFGNLVSPAWWDDLWLNEGFATFVTFNGLQAVHPEWNVEQWFLMDVTRAGLQADGIKASHPIYLQGIEAPDEIIQYFDDISYRKGGSVIRMVEYLMGKETFQAGLKNYLTSLKFGNARHQDLFKALGEQTRLENRTIDVQEFLAPWIYQMGYPVVTVEYTGTGNIRLTQERFVFNSEATDPGTFTSKYGYKWPIPFTYTTSHMTNFNVSNDKIIMMGIDENAVHIRSDNIPSPTGSNWLIGNLKYMGFFTVNYDERNWNAIMDQLVTNHKVIDPLNRLQIIIDSWNLVESGHLDIAIALKTFDYISMETEPAHLMAIQAEVQKMNVLLYRSATYGSFRAYMKTVWTKLFNTVGLLTAGPNDPLTPAREFVTYLACGFGNEDCVNRAKDLFSSWMSNPSVRPIGLDPANALAVYCTAIRQGGDVEFDFLLSKYENETFYTERNTLLSGLTCTRQPHHAIRLLRLGLTPAVVAKEKAMMAEFLSWNDLTESTVWDFYRSHFDQFQNELGTYWNMNVLSSLAATFTSPLRLNEIKQLGKDKGINDHTTYKNSVERTERNIKWVEKKGPVIERWLTDKGF